MQIFGLWLTQPTAFSPAWWFSIEWLAGGHCALQSLALIECSILFPHKYLELIVAVAITVTVPVREHFFLYVKSSVYKSARGLITHNKHTKVVLRLNFEQNNKNYSAKKETFLKRRTHFNRGKEEVGNLR